MDKLTEVSLHNLAKGMDMVYKSLGFNEIKPNIGIDGRCPHCLSTNITDTGCNNCNESFLGG